MKTANQFLMRAALTFLLISLSLVSHAGTLISGYTRTNALGPNDIVLLDVWDGAAYHTLSIYASNLLQSAATLGYLSPQTNAIMHGNFQAGDAAPGSKFFVEFPNVTDGATINAGSTGGGPYGGFEFRDPTNCVTVGMAYTNTPVYETNFFLETFPNPNGLGVLGVGLIFDIFGKVGAGASTSHFREEIKTNGDTAFYRMDANNKRGPAMAYFSESLGAWIGVNFMGTNGVTGPGTIGASGNVVTGSGTSFTSLRPGDCIFAGANGAEIASITSDTVLLTMDPYTVSGGSSYSIQRAAVSGYGLSSTNRGVFVETGGNLLVTGLDPKQGDAMIGLVKGDSRWGLVGETAGFGIRNRQTTTDGLMISTNASGMVTVLNLSVNTNAQIGGSVGVVGITNSGAYTAGPLALTWGSTTTINFTTNEMQTLSITGDTTFASSNLAPGRMVNVLVTGDGSNRNLTWPGGWICTGSIKPTSLSASKHLSLWLYSAASADASVWMSVAVEP